MQKSRATLIVSEDEPDHVLAAHAWLDAHRQALDFVSENIGCGCCVHMWRIEGDATVVQAVPDALLGISAWDQGFEV